MLEYRVLIGNPGSGKSTILNSMVDKIIFKSGVSLGCGLTKVCREHPVGDIVYVDTPGLDDVSFRKQAATQIDELMARVRNLKVAFVMTLESGRIRPTDIQAMSVILNSLNKNIDNKFGIIINKVDANLDKKGIEAEFERLFTLDNIEFKTNRIMIIPLVPELYDEDDVIATKDLKVSDFMEELPLIVVDRAIPLNLDNYVETVSELRERLDRARNENQQELAKMRVEGRNESECAQNVSIKKSEEPRDAEDHQTVQSQMSTESAEPEKSSKPSEASAAEPVAAHESDKRGQSEADMSDEPQTKEMRY